MKHHKERKAHEPPPPVPWKATTLHIAIVFIVALAVRLIYIHQLSKTCFFAPFKGGFDDYIFDTWAQEILKGNWLGDRAIFIYRMPLYVYFLALVYQLFGHSYWAIYLVHSLIGAATCVAVFYMGRMLFSDPAGIIAAVITALCGPLLYFNGMVVGETLGIFLSCLAVIALLLFQRKGKIAYLLPGGLFLGLAMLIRGNMLAMLPFILIWAASIRTDMGALRRALCAGVLTLGVTVAVLPIMTRNFLYEKDIVPIAASGGLNLYIGNAQGADGKFRTVKGVGSNADQMLRGSVEVAEKAEGRKLRPSEVSNYWVRETVKSVMAGGVGRFCALLGKKAAIFWNSYEIPDIWDIYFFRDYIPLLRLPFFSMLVVAPLAAGGLYLGWPRRRELSLIYVFIIGYMFSLLLFFISSRYRAGLMPVLALPAAYMFTEIPKLAKGPAKKAVAVAAVIAAVMIFTNLPVEKLSFETSYNSLGIMLKRSGKPEDALKAYGKAIEISPNYPTPYYNIGILYRDKGDLGEAAKYFKKAVELAPDFGAARKELEALRGFRGE